MARKLLTGLALIVTVWTQLTPMGLSASVSVRWEESREARHQQGCELVELYPGYPGYRGLVAGLVGYAETACLEDLIALEPTFSIREQDEENDRIAAQLGIPGTKLERTWEAWMAIGAARGYGAVCYSCYLVDLPMPLIEGTGAIGPDDPRASLLSWPQSPQFASEYFARIGLENPTGFPSYMQDVWLRPIAFAIIPGLAITNADLLGAAEKVVSDYWCLSGSNCISFDGYKLACFFIERGGYVAPPAGIHELDRLYLITVALLAAQEVGSSGLGNELFEIAMNDYAAAIQRDTPADPVSAARTAFGQC